jgi:hypothetical protein
MRGMLLLAVLNVKCSYSRELEIALEGEDDVPRHSSMVVWRRRLLADTYLCAGS